jgi:hypothetical protein
MCDHTKSVDWCIAQPNALERDEAFIIRKLENLLLISFEIRRATSDFTSRIVSESYLR